jgi:hypothetical protein
MEVSGELHAPAALLPVPILQEAGSTPEPVWTCGEEKNILSLKRSEPPFLGRPDRSLVAIPTELSKLPLV